MKKIALAINKTTEKYKHNHKIGMLIIISSLVMIISIFIPLFWNPFYLINQLTIGFLFGDIGALVFYTWLSLYSLKHFFKIGEKIKFNLFWMLFAFMTIPLIVMGISYPFLTGNSPYYHTFGTFPEIYTEFWLDPWVARWQYYNWANAAVLLPGAYQMGIVNCALYYGFFGVFGSMYALSFFLVVFTLFVYMSFTKGIDFKIKDIFKRNSKEKAVSKNTVNLTSTSLNEIKTQEFVAEQLNPVKNRFSIIDDLDPNNPKDLVLLNALRKIEKKNLEQLNTKNENISTSTEKERLEKLRQDLILKTTSQKAVVTPDETKEEIFEARKRRILEKGYISPTSGLKKELMKEDTLEVMSAKTNARTTEEVALKLLDDEDKTISGATIEEIKNRKMTSEMKLNLTIESALGNDIIANEIESIPEIEKFSNDFFKKTIEKELALSTSKTLKELEEKTDLNQSELADILAPAVNNFNQSREVIINDSENFIQKEAEIENQFNETVEAIMENKIVEKQIKNLEADTQPIIYNKDGKIEIKPNEEPEEIEIVKRDKNWCAKYKLPPQEMLEDVEDSTDLKIKQEQDAVAKSYLINELFEKFSIAAKVIKYEIGPTVTSYEVLPDSATKLSKISNIEDNIKLTLEAKDIIIQTPIPGRNVVGIQVPNTFRKSVTFARSFAQTKETKGEISIAFGQDVNGKGLYFDLAKTPHLLVAGSTGSGKSVAINTIIASILMRYEPQDIQLILIDPKMVEFAPYHNIPHLITPVITNATNANIALKETVKIMEERYLLMAKEGVRNIVELNAKYKVSKQEKLPYLVVIIDELADLMMVAAKEVEQSIMRITAKARAAGIHLIVATQRPSTDIITGTIKANIPSRIAFTVASSIDSRTILDRVGAEKLVGQGDMLISLYGQFPTRAQGAYISNDEIEAITKHVKKQCSCAYLIDIKQEEAVLGAMGNVIMDETDPDYQKAKKIVIQAQKASTSMLQRYMNVGYNKAADLMESLEHYGVIGPSQGSKPREVLLKE